MSFSEPTLSGTIISHGACRVGVAVLQSILVLIYEIAILYGDLK